jgi:catechol 2,3-dioxygenase-like lactoylglutathione lyase family enzyme
MTIDHGQPPKGGFAKLVSELLVEDLRESLYFWREALGLEIAYQRPEQKFAYLQRPEGAQVMLRERSEGRWETAAMEKPYGRGVMFQIHVSSIDPIIEHLKNLRVPLYAGPREVWRRYGDREGGRREVLIPEPNGYLVMLAEDLGERPL